MTNEPDLAELQAYGAPLYINIRALSDALAYPGREFPAAYMDRQAIDDLCVLMHADQKSVEGQIIKRLQDTLQARNQELHMLRQLYCAASASRDEAAP